MRTPSAAWYSPRARAPPRWIWFYDETHGRWPWFVPQPAEPRRDACVPHPRRCVFPLCDPARQPHTPPRTLLRAPACVPRLVG